MRINEYDKFYRTCITCNGSKEVPLDLYSANVNGIYKRTCSSCNGAGIIECTEEIQKLYNDQTTKEDIYIAVKSFIEDIRYIDKEE